MSLEALLIRLRRSKATLSLSEPVKSLKACGPSDWRSEEMGTGTSKTQSQSPFLPKSLNKSHEFFEVLTPLRKVKASCVILTTGGQSYPGSGTTGDGYDLTRSFGHTLVPTRPALVPIRIAEGWLTELRGITLPDVRIDLIEDSKPLAARRGSLLVAHFGLSGPVILDLSRHVSGHPQPTRLRLVVDFLPAVSEPQLDEVVKDLSVGSSRKQLSHVLAPALPRRLVELLLKKSGFEEDRRAACITRDERARLVGALKRFELSVLGTLGFGKAEVTAGGVDLSEVDSRTMESKKQPGLFIAGELLDLDGPIGGYNFQAAFSTGWLAGRTAGSRAHQPSM